MRVVRRTDQRAIGNEEMGSELLGMGPGLLEDLSRCRKNFILKSFDQRNYSN